MTTTTNTTEEAIIAQLAAADWQILGAGSQDAAVRDSRDGWVNLRPVTLPCGIRISTGFWFCREARRTSPGIVAGGGMSCNPNDSHSTAPGFALTPYRWPECLIAIPTSLDIDEDWLVDQISEALMANADLLARAEAATL